VDNAAWKFMQKIVYLTIERATTSKVIALLLCLYPIKDLIGFFFSKW